MIFRVNKNNNYTVMSNHHLRDKSLSLKAKGLLSQMLSLPDDWNFSVNGLISLNREEKTAITAALKELKDNGYLRVTKQTNRDGRFEWVYDIYETPYTGFPCMEKPCMEKPYMENPCMENQPLLNTNIQNTDKLNTDKQNIDRGRFAPPTLEEVRSYCEERKNNIDPEAFIDYYKSQKWKKANGQLLADWKAGVRYWERKEYNKKPKQQQFANSSFETSDLEALFASDLENIVKDGEKNGV